MVNYQPKGERDVKIGNIPGRSTTTAKAVRQAKAKIRANAKLNSNSLFQASSNKKSTSALKSAISDSVKSAQLKKNYKLMVDTADSLQKRASKLLETTDDSLFGRAIQKTGGTQKTGAELASNKEKVVAEINSFIKDYNSLIDTMSNTDEAVNNLYLKQLKSFASENKTAFKELGITQKSDGALTIDQKTLKAAETVKLQKVFGSKNSFVQKVSEKSKNADDNADIQLASLNKSYTYNRSGYLRSSYDSSGSIYNTKG
jgi:hypothetical protein